MNDRFKFRVWNKRTEEMLDVRLISYFSTGNICRVEAQNAVGDIKILDDYKTSIEDIELMQCTGLKDKNGKLIFEGDILYENMINTVFPKGKYWIVEWNNDTAQFFIELINKTGNSLTDTWHLARHSYDYEVIGNIYEDKELLNEI